MLQFNDENPIGTPQQVSVFGGDHAICLTAICDAPVRTHTATNLVDQPVDP
jgi:hypothetical protein